jgi:K+-transporting ATPase ATPase C chain
MSVKDVESVIRKYTTGKFLGVMGEPRVNVLKVNLALDGLI